MIWFPSEGSEGKNCGYCSEAKDKMKLILSFINSLTMTLIHSYIKSHTHLSMHSPSYSFTHSFIYPLIHSSNKILPHSFTHVLTSSHQATHTSTIVTFPYVELKGTDADTWRCSGACQANEVTGTDVAGEEGSTHLLTTRKKNEKADDTRKHEKGEEVRELIWGVRRRSRRMKRRWGMTWGRWRRRCMRDDMRRRWKKL